MTFMSHSGFHGGFTDLHVHSRSASNSLIFRIKNLENRQLHLMVTPFHITTL